MAFSETSFYTADMVRELIDEHSVWPRYETLYGELAVTPAPRIAHQYAVGEVFASLHAYLKREHVGLPFMSPADISWGRSDVLVQPDVFVVQRSTLVGERASTATWSTIHHLLLAVEIVSASTSRRDRFAKRRLYQQQGVPLYWVIDLDDASAEVWTPGDEAPTVERGALTWHADGASEAFTLPIAALIEIR